MLVDRARIYVKAGDGGNGAASFRRERYVPRGGPDGGDGGRGGDVVLRVNPSLTTLLPFQYNQQFKAESGGSGMKQQRHGKAGHHLVVDVPPGTVVFDDETGERLADLVEPGDELVVATGGRGGLGNVHFKSSTRQAPRLAELGEPGAERWLRLELRLIADAGLVGLPNAGKSTLLAASSAARPKIGDYPFTTLEPLLGVVEVGGKGGRSFVLADVPGLIEGAAAGAGLGHDFLRHLARTRVLVHVLDAAGGLEGRDALDDFRIVNQELAAHGDDLAAKPMLVALNKIDLGEAQAQVPRLRSALKAQGYEVFEVSAATGRGVPELMNAVAGLLDRLTPEAGEQATPQRRRFTLPTVDERAWQASRRSAHHFDVTGIGIERLTKMTNFASDEAVERFQRVLDSSGINEELTRQGIQDGDVVHIAGYELVWGEQEGLGQAAAPQRSPRRQRRG